MAICPGGQKWLHNPTPHVSRVLGCDRSLKWAQLWSQQPREWPKGLKNEWKWPYYGYVWAIGVVLWRRDPYNMDIYWHPWFGAIFTTFGYLEVSFADNSFIVLRMSWKEPAPFTKPCFKPTNPRFFFDNFVWIQILIPFWYQIFSILKLILF